MLKIPLPTKPPELWEGYEQSALTPGGLSPFRLTVLPGGGVQIKLETKISYGFALSGLALTIPLPETAVMGDIVKVILGFKAEKKGGNNSPLRSITKLHLYEFGYKDNEEVHFVANVPAGIHHPAYPFARALVDRWSKKEVTFRIDHVADPNSLPGDSVTIYYANPCLITGT